MSPKRRSVAPSGESQVDNEIVLKHPGNDRSCSFWALLLVASNFSWTSKGQESQIISWVTDDVKTGKKISYAETYFRTAAITDCSLRLYGDE